jgi:C4-dicarboxylate transporter
MKYSNKRKACGIKMPIFYYILEVIGIILLTKIILDIFIMLGDISTTQILIICSFGLLYIFRKGLRTLEILDRQAYYCKKK